MGIRKKLAKEIALQCLRMNSIGDERKRSDGKPCVFYEVNGHIGSVCVRVHEKGWSSGSDPDRLFTLDEFEKPETFRNCLNYLRSLEVQN